MKNEEQKINLILEFFEKYKKINGKKKGKKLAKMLLFYLEDIDFKNILLNFF